MFVLEEGERVETGLIQMNIDTGDATPRCQLVRHTPFAARQEIAHTALTNAGSKCDISLR